MNSVRSQVDRSERALAAWGWLPVAWYVVFMVVPLAVVVAVSFAERGVYGGLVWNLSFANFHRAFDPIYARILWHSFVLALATAISCLVLAYPVAVTLATLPRRWRNSGLVLLAVPFLTNLVVRVGALKAIVAYDGPLAALLDFMSIHFDRFALSQNQPLVAYGLVTTYLPFAIFPMYAALERFDFSLVEAARDLGANDWVVHRRVVLPSIRRALASAFMLVFIPALGEFVIPDLLGGAKVILNGGLISDQFLKSRDWPFGAALAICLLLTIGLFLLIGKGLTRSRQERA